LSIAGSGVIVLIATLDATAFLGFLVPGQTFVLMLGGLTSTGILSFTKTVVLVAVGAMLGDVISYTIGRFAPGMFTASDGKKNKYIQTGSEYIQRSLITALIIDRFILPWRPIIPFVAGTMKIARYKVFVPAFTLDIVFAVSFVSAGYLLGRGVSIVAVLSGPMVATGIVAAVVVGVFWYAARHTVEHGKSHAVFARKMYVVLREYVSQLSLTRWFATHFVHTNRFIQARFANTSLMGLPLTVAAFMGILLVVSLSDVAVGVMGDQEVIAQDRALNLFFYTHQVSYLTTIMLIFTTVADKYVITALLLLTLFVLYLKKLRQVMLPVVVVVTGAVLTTYLGKLLVARPRPEWSQITELSFSFPSGHATAAMVLFGLLAFLLVRYAQSWSLKIHVLYGAVFLIGTIGFSRVYLGVHYLSDVLAGYIVGGLWLLLGISFILWTESRQAENTSR